MSKLPWVRFFPSDWLAGTRGMSACEAGIYITLIATMYERNEPVPEDQKRLARLCGASLSSFRKALDMLIDDGKIQRTSDGLWNERVEKENSFRAEKSQVGQQNAIARWGKKYNKNNGRDDAIAMQRQCNGNANQKPDTRKKKEDLRSSKKASQIPKNFEPDLEWAISRSLPRQMAETEAEKFRNYWIAEGKPKKDWNAAWRNWVLKALEYRGISASLPQAEGDDDWIRRLVHARRTGQWATAKWGPMPGEGGCRCPSKLIKPGDGKNWQEWEIAA